MPRNYVTRDKRKVKSGKFWKVHDLAKVIVLHSHTMHELLNQHVPIG